MPGIDPFSHPTMPLEELERFVVAVETLDREEECPPVAIPNSLDDHVEVLRIADNCMHLEYHALNGRTLWQARHEIKLADPAVFAVSVPSDDLLLNQTDSLDYSDYTQWHLEPLQVAELQAGWPSNTSDPVVVAVIDSGVHGNHTILDSRLVTSRQACHRQPHNDDEGRVHTHGTHVAGIVAAEDTPASDVVGIAPLARILSIKVEFTGDTNTGVCRTDTPTLAEALARVYRSGADIVNMSLRWHGQEFADRYFDYQSGLEWCIAIGPSNCSTSLQNALATMANCVARSGPNNTCELQHWSETRQLRGEDATELVLSALAMKSVVPVAAAGNCGNDEPITKDITDNQGVTRRVTRPHWRWNVCPHHNALQSPATYSSTIAVAALDDANNRATFSTANGTVSIAAPGDEIRSTVEPNNVGDKSGTSMAAPMIAGVVAHMKARFPQATYEQITEALSNTAARGPTGQDSNCDTPLAHDQCYGRGIVQPLRAINYLASLRAPIAYITDETGSNQIARIGRDGEKSVLTNSSDMNWGPSLSPDGLQIVFARGSPGDLWTIGTNGAERQLTSTSQAEYAPSWSPNGDRIVYFRHESHIKVSPCGFLWRNTCREFVRQPHEIWVMDRDGSNAEMFHSDHNILAPSWTSDGTAILFDLNGDIASLDLVTKQVRILLGDGHNYCPTSSPDSGMIAYSSERSGNQELYVMNADGTNRRRLTDDPAADWCPVWMPDGKSLVFTSDRDGDEDIYIVDVDGTNLRPLTHNDHRDFQPSVTKSGEAAAIIASADLTVQLIDPLPAAVDAAGGEFAALSSSWDHVCSSLESRSALCWGSSASESESAPAEALTGASAGGGHSCALGSGGAVVCWGGGFLGQTDAPEGSFTAVAAGWDHTCGLNSSGGIECWGSDEHGQASPPSGRFTAVSAGDGHSCALDEAGRITCWGLDDDGQASPPSGRFTAIDTGSAHSCALDEAGAVTCWGANWFGQADTPEGSFVEVAAGYGHTCALDEGGLAFCWGLNNDFQANAPYRVFTTMTAGRAHACGLDIHAEVMCWGTIEPHDE